MQLDMLKKLKLFAMFKIYRDDYIYQLIQKTDLQYEQRKAVA